MPKSTAKPNDRAFHREFRQLAQWPENLSFPNDPDPNDGNVTRFNARESLSPSLSTSWNCLESTFAGIG